MIWQDMSFDDKQTLINKYNDIRKNIKKLNSAKANTEKKTKYSELQLKDYNDKVKELQEQYNEIKIQYRCDYCNSIIDLPFDKIKNLLKGKESPIFCDRKCSGSYYAYKSHKGKTEKQEQERRDKISQSLRKHEDIPKNDKLNTIKKENINKINTSLCAYCKKEFIPSKYQLRQINNDKPIFCSISCSNKFKYENNHEHISENDLIRKIQDMFNNTEMSYDEIMKSSGVSQSKFKEIVKKYNIKRSKGKSNKLKIKHMQETMQKEYNVQNIMQLQEYRDKIKINQALKTIDEKKEISQKVAKTKKLLYGSSTYNNREKAQKTNLEKYGVANIVEREDVREKCKQGSIAKFGVENPFNSKEVQLKADKILREKYGDKKSFADPEVRRKAEITNEKRYGNKNAFRNEDIQHKQFNTIKERYGVEYACQTENCANASPKAKSKPNTSFIELLHPEKTEIPIGKYRYDMLKDNTLIEIDPTFTHNTFKNPYGTPKDKNYHLDKTKIAIDNGYKCIHIFDWDDKDKIKYLFLDKEQLYARALSISKVSLEDTTSFLNEYHLQNTCKGQIIRLGLYYKQELIEIMTFGKPRYNKNYEWELLRLCTHKDYKVVGGAEKLFKHFLDTISPNSIISYCDFSKFTGDVYLRLGFKQQGIAKPSKHWCKGTKHITDNLLRQRGYDQLFKANFGKGTSNEELMLEHGWLPIYDCGQLTFIWYK